MSDLPDTIMRRLRAHLRAHAPSLAALSQNKFDAALGDFRAEIVEIEARLMTEIERELEREFYGDDE